MQFGGEGVALIGTVADVQSCQHIAFGGDAQTGTAAFGGLLADLKPQFSLHTLHILTFGIAVNLSQNLVNLFQLEIDKVIHQALGALHMLSEKRHVEIGLVSERILHITVEVHSDQTAAVVRAQRNLTARVGGNSLKTIGFVAIRHRLALNGIPEKDARFSGFPCIVNDFFPEFGSVYFLFILRIFRADRILLRVRGAYFGGFHEVIVHFHGNISASDFPFCHFSIYKLL